MKKKKKKKRILLQYFNRVSLVYQKARKQDINKCTLKYYVLKFCNYKPK